MSPVRTILLLLAALVVSLIFSNIGTKGRGRLSERWRADFRLLGRCILAAVVVYWIAIIARAVTRAISG